MKQGLKFFSAIAATIFIGWFVSCLDASAFNGPTNSAGIGSGAVGVNTYNSLSVGTTTTDSSTMLLVVASSENATEYGLKILDQFSDVLLSVRNDGVVNIDGTSFSPGGSYNGTLNASQITGGEFGSGIYAGDTYGFGGPVTATSGTISLATTTVNGRLTAATIQITGVTGCNGTNQALQTGGAGVVNCTALIGTVSTSSAITTGTFPEWSTTAGALSGTSTLSLSGTTLTNSGNESLAGNLNVTGTATFTSSLTQSGATVSLASTTITGLLNLTGTFSESGGVVKLGQTTFKSGIIASSTNLDSVSTCGSSPSIVGSDGIGRVTTGSNATTTCTITFGVAFANKPICIISSETLVNSTTSYYVNPSASTLIIKPDVSSTAMQSVTFDYICIGQ